MSVGIYNKNEDKLHIIASAGTNRTFVGTKSAVDAAVQAGDITDETVVYITDDYKDKPLQPGIPVGCILPFAGKGNLPNGYLLCDGSEFSEEAYPDLLAVLGENKVPNLIDRYIIGSPDLATNGTFIPEQLPNIKGKFSLVSDSPEYPSEGCIDISNDPTEILNGLFDFGGNGGWGRAHFANFDASKTSSGNGEAYQDGAKVRPDSVQLVYIIKAL